MIKFKIISNKDAQSEPIQLFKYLIDKAKKSDSYIITCKNNLQILVKAVDEQTKLSKDFYHLITLHIQELRNNYCKIKDLEVLLSLTMQVYEADILIKSLQYVT